MSRLDDKLFGITDHEKEIIKDLMLKLVDDVYQQDAYENELRPTEMWHEICNKIKEL